MAGDDRPALIVAITGGSGSGKTTLADGLAAALRPRAAAVLREDDYYRDNAAAPGFDPEQFNFDHVETRDHALLAAHLRSLKAGRAIERPCYDFVSHARLPARVTIAPAEIVIVEGTHLLHPPDLRALCDCTIYLDVPDDVRLARRVLRDIGTRGRSPDTVIRQYFRTVRPMHYRFTEPSRAFAHIVLRFDDDAVASEPGSQRQSLADAIDLLARRVRALLSATPAGERA